MTKGSVQFAETKIGFYDTPFDISALHQIHCLTLSDYHSLPCHLFTPRRVDVAQDDVHPDDVPTSSPHYFLSGKCAMSLVLRKASHRIYNSHRRVMVKDLETCGERCMLYLRAMQEPKLQVPPASPTTSARAGACVASTPEWTIEAGNLGSWRTSALDPRMPNLPPPVLATTSVSAYVAGRPEWTIEAEHPLDPLVRSKYQEGVLEDLDKQCQRGAINRQREEVSRVEGSGAPTPGNRRVPLADCAAYLDESTQQDVVEVP
ncbi:hypothetical protein C8Q80DRAFT_1269973 [Daedaleopsis nitida]|nr:hypothetical protein C8Q80DRAFT_1269973 [Daedaleopsis nitida]